MRWVVGLALVVCACSRTGGDLSRFHEDGRAKPAVAIMSVIDGTSFDAPWSLSEELTSMIVQKVGQNGSIYVLAKGDLGYADNPFGTDLSWIKREYPDDEFVVFCELVEHDNVPLSKGKKSSDVIIPFETAMNLKMAVRVRVVDLRTSTPKIVLQEMVRNSYYIPKNIIPTDYSYIVWGTAEYSSTPMGLAHAELANEIATRVGEYIHLAKSR
jgi:hypothetical protein